MESIDALREAVTALDIHGGIDPHDTAAIKLRLVLCRMERDHYETELDALRTDWNELVETHQAAQMGLIDAQNEIARLEAELSRTSDAMDDEIERARLARRWAAAWKRAAKHQRRMEREIEAAVERRDERIRIQDATITELLAHRDRLMAEVAARPEPVPFEPSSPGENIKPKAARRVTRSTGEHRCVCGKVFTTKQALGSHRRTHTSEPVPEPQPEPVPDHVAAAWSEELSGLYRCPQCQSLAFAQALHGDMCVKCAAERKAA